MPNSVTELFRKVSNPLAVYSIWFAGGVLFYVLSAGPCCYLIGTGAISEGNWGQVEGFYRPLIYASDNSGAIGQLLEGYAAFWYDLAERRTRREHE